MRTRTRERRGAKIRFSGVVTGRTSDLLIPPFSPSVCGTVSTTGTIDSYYEKEMMTDQITPGPIGIERAVSHRKYRFEPCIGDGVATWYAYNPQGYRTQPACSLLTDGRLPDPVANAPGYSVPDLEDPLPGLIERLDVLRDSAAMLPFLGEFKQAVSMVRRPLGFLRRLPSMKQWRNLPIGEVLSRMGLSRGSSAWLEYQYGWRPFLSDIGDFAEKLGGATDMYELYKKGSPPTRKARASSHATVTLTGSDAYEWAGSAGCRLSVSLKYGFHPAAMVENPLSRSAFTLRSLGISPRQILSTALELTPWSFVVEWFIPIGEMISRATAAPSSFFMEDISYHRKVEENFVYLGSVPSFTPGYGCPGSPTLTPVPIYRARGFQYERNTPLAKPGGEEYQPLTTSRAISALALIAQKLVRPL